MIPMEERTFLVTYHTKPGCREAFMRRLAEIGAPEAVRAEEGCRQYDYYLSVQDENEILLVERWESLAHQQKHLTQPHMAGIGEAKAQFVERTELKCLAEDLHAL